MTIIKLLKSEVLISSGVSLFINVIRNHQTASASLPKRRSAVESS